MFHLHISYFLHNTNDFTRIIILYKLLRYIFNKIKKYMLDTFITFSTMRIKYLLRLSKIAQFDPLVVFTFNYNLPHDFAAFIAPAEPPTLR